MPIHVMHYYRLHVSMENASHGYSCALHLLTTIPVDPKKIGPCICSICSNKEIEYRIEMRLCLLLIYLKIVFLTSRLTYRFHAMMIHGHSLRLIVLMEYSVWSPFVNWPNRDLCSISNVLLLIHTAKILIQIDVSGSVRSE